MRASQDRAHKTQKKNQGQAHQVSGERELVKKQSKQKIEKKKDQKQENLVSALSDR